MNVLEKVAMEKFGVDFGMEKVLLLKFFFLEMKRLGLEKLKFTGMTNI